MTASASAVPPPGWIMHMRWLRLLFMHWPVPAATLRPLIPAGLEIDTFDNQAWIGIVPFLMANVRPRWMPPMPGTSAFAELNVRTYVKHRGEAGVWFFSLDAASRLAVRMARRLWHLPYFDAAMTVRQNDDWIDYQSVRTHRDAPPATLRMRYRPRGSVFHSKPGEFEDFLTNRLCLFAANRKGNIYRGAIHHAAWPLQSAEAEIEQNTMAQQIGVALPDARPHLLYSDRLDVVAWRIRRVV